MSEPDPTRFITVRACITGNSGLHENEYWIPIQRISGEVLSDAAIQFAIEGLFDIAILHPDWCFLTSRLGNDSQEQRIAPMFQGAPPNVLLPGEW